MRTIRATGIVALASMGAAMGAALRPADGVSTIASAPESAPSGASGASRSMLLLEGEALLAARRLAGAPAPVVCFSPDDESKYPANFDAALRPGFGPRYNTPYYWGPTALNPTGSDIGEPTTLTYSFIPDGTDIPAAISGEVDSPSAMFAYLNGIYGSPAVWQPLYHDVMQRWGQLTGITFVHEPNDDGAAFPGSPGVTGVRGDLRFGGHPLNGPGGVLAYNYYPDFGDMVIDTADTFYLDTSAGSLRLRNVLAHEVGHGIGIAHSCPRTNTKLMEPFLSTAFDGPQHDDIRAGQFLYGDPSESDDDPAGATDLGTLPPLTLMTLGGVAPPVPQGSTLSVDNDFDDDFYRFTLLEALDTTFAVQPVGTTYDASAQQCPGQSGNCCSGNIIDSGAMKDFTLTLLESDGTTTIASSDANGPGGAESVSIGALPAGTYLVRVTGFGLPDQSQLYSLFASTGDGAPCPADIDDGSATGTPDGSVDIADLLYFLSLFDVGDLDADFDDGSATGTPDGSVDISDLLYYLALFDVGC